MACPFAHRTLIVRQLKGLDEAISIDVAHWNKGENGWHFAKDKDDELCTADSVNGKKFIRDIYLADNPKYKGAFSVPLLFDKEEGKIVNNESGDIIKSEEL